MSKRCKTSTGEYWPVEGEFRIEERGDGSFVVYETEICGGGAYMWWGWQASGKKYTTREEALGWVRDRKMEDMVVRKEVIS